MLPLPSPGLFPQSDCVFPHDTPVPTFISSAQNSWVEGYFKMVQPSLGSSREFHGMKLDFLSS